jgi:hypothetical protein
VTLIVDRVAAEDRVTVAGCAGVARNGGPMEPARRDGVEYEGHRFEAVEAERRALGDEEPCALGGRGLKLTR